MPRSRFTFVLVTNMLLLNNAMHQIKIHDEHVKETDFYWLFQFKWGVELSQFILIQLFGQRGKKAQMPQQSLVHKNLILQIYQMNISNEKVEETNFS